MKKLWLLIIFLNICFPSVFGQVVDVNGIIFNEINYDATTNNGGQWNGTGIDDATLEFIEFYNSGSSTVNIANWIICDANSFRFQFNNTTRNIGAGQSFVLTDEIGTYSPPVNHFIYDVDNEGTTAGSWSLGNSGDCLFLINPGPDNAIGGSDDIWITFRYNNVGNSTTTYGPLTPSGTNNGTEVTALDVADQSLNRNTDITGTSWAGHLSLNATLACSPNRKTDGTTPLPVELTSFTGTAKGKVVSLNWSTKTEVNNYGFEILRSDKTGEWEKIGFVAGSGNSNSPKEYSYTDSKTTGYGKYSYKLKQIDNDGKYTYTKEVEVDLGIVKEYELSQNYPNPFNPSTVIRYAIPQSGNVKLSVYNILGQEVKVLTEGYKEAGSYEVTFDGEGLGSGLYIYKLESGKYSKVMKMTLIK